MTLGSARIVIVLCLAVTACTRPAGREYELRGQILGVDPARQQVTIKHQDIPQFMPGMTMAFRVEDRQLLDGRVAGELVTATLIVRGSEARLRTLQRTGFSPVADVDGSPLPMAVIAPGEEVADAAFLDHTGTSQRLSSWRGTAVAVTFMYTRCPMPDYCPLMDRRFKAVHDDVRRSEALANRVRLLSISIDPDHDTPAVLAAHGSRVQADARTWQFWSGAADEMQRFARQFGVSISRGGNDGNRGSDGDIVHNMRTAVVDAQGRLFTILSGAEWEPSELVRHLADASARTVPRHE